MRTEKIEAMRLSTKGRYGTRAMLDVAIHQDGGPVSVKATAERQDVSRRYLEQLMLRLATAGLARPVRGRGGGFVLSRPASQISVADIVQALEGPINVVECVGDAGVCYRASSCAAREVWNEVSETVTCHLSQITLEDMAQRHRRSQETATAMYYI